MPWPRTNAYAQWRAQNEARAFLLERQVTDPPERLLQAIWRHQRLRREGLHTLEGRPVRVLHPGFWNREAGPDFRGAVLQFGADPPQTGDVEVDYSGSLWRLHQHDANPAYTGVILHVIWSGQPAGVSALPTLALESVLDSPVNHLKMWLGSAVSKELPAGQEGECQKPLRGAPAETARDIIQQAAQIRFQRKAQQLEARAREAGWEQALWEGLFRGLGYKQNVWPFQRLAELLPRLYAPGDSLPLIQARLLGVAGLLPADLGAGTEEADAYVRQLWDHWWRERERFSDLILPPAAWRFYGLRPANQPQRRLALASHWLASGNLPARLEQWFMAAGARKDLAESLLALWQPESDEYWSNHWSLRSVQLPQAQPMLGIHRATDLAINTVLPWFWARARAGGNEVLQETAEQLYLRWPSGQENSPLALARKRLLGERSLDLIESAATQQGLLQIVADFCNHSNAVCENCPFPEFVKECVRK